MFLSTSMLPKVAEEYISSVLLPKAPTPAVMFAIGFALPYVAGATENQLAQMAPVLKSLGIVNEQNKIDLEKAKDAAYKGLQKAGGQLNLYGYTADQTDINTLFALAEKYAVTG